MTARTATAVREDSPGLLAIASYPAQRASLTSLVAMAIAMPLTVLPLVGYVVQLVLWAAAYHYAVEVFRRSANGTFAAPEFAPNNHGIGWRLLVLQMLFALGHWALQAYVFPPLPRLLGIGLLALLQPAMTLTVAMNLNLPAAFAIHRVLRVIAALGIGYWLLVLAGVGLGAVQEFVGLVVASGRTYVLVVMAGISQAGAAQVGALFGGSGLHALLAQAIAGLLWFYAVTAYFHAMGVLVHARAGALGFEPEPFARLRPEDHHAPLLRRIDDLLARQRFAEAAHLLGECLATQLNTSPDMHARYRDLLRRIDDRAGLLDHARGRIDALLAADSAREAVAMAREALAIDPMFRPAAGERTMQLAQAAERLGQPELALDLLRDFPDRYPRNEAMADAALAAARLHLARHEDPHGARMLVQAALERMLPAHPRHAELARECERLASLTTPTRIPPAA